MESVTVVVPDVRCSRRCDAMVVRPVCAASQVNPTSDSSAVTVHTAPFNPGCVTRARLPTLNGGGDKRSTWATDCVHSGQRSTSVITFHTRCRSASMSIETSYRTATSPHVRDFMFGVEIGSCARRKREHQVDNAPFELFVGVGGDLGEQLEHRAVLGQHAGVHVDRAMVHGPGNHEIE